MEKCYIKLTKHAGAKLKWGNKRFTEVLYLNVFQIANVGQVCLRMGFWKHVFSIDLVAIT